MAEPKNRYRLTFAEDKDKSKQPQGAVVRLLTDVQVDRLRRHGVENPRARLLSIEPAEDGEG